MIVDPATSDKTESYIAKLVELRQKKGMTEEQAREILLTNYLYYGVMMVKMGDVTVCIRSIVILQSDTPSSVSADPEDKTGNKISIRILCNGSAGLRYGCRRYIYFWRFRTGAESGS